MVKSVNFTERKTLTARENIARATLAKIELEEDILCQKTT